MTQAKERGTEEPRNLKKRIGTFLSPHRNHARGVSAASKCLTPHLSRPLKKLNPHKSERQKSIKAKSHARESRRSGRVPRQRETPKGGGKAGHRHPVPFQDKGDITKTTDDIKEQRKPGLAN